MRLIDADKVKEKLRGNAQKDGDPFVGAVVEMFCEFLDQFEDAEERGEIGRVLQWIPVTERMPEDDYLPLDKAVQIKVLVCNINTGKRSIRTLSRQRVQVLTKENGELRWIWRWEWSKNVRDADITHWSPPPELPEVNDHA